jgi:hypothetical protein
MKPEWLQTMMDAISEVLETMFFSMVDFEGRGKPVGTRYCEARIRLTDEDEVTIRFRVVEEFARVLTANFLGSGEEQVKPEEIEDAMKELVNMVGGFFQPRVPEKRWRLGIPAFRLLEGASAPAPGAGAPESVLDLPLYFLGEPGGWVILEFAKEPVG